MWDFSVKEFGLDEDLIVDANAKLHSLVLMGWTVGELNWVPLSCCGLTIIVLKLP
jgi:hypothetical protein